VRDQVVCRRRGAYLLALRVGETLASVLEGEPKYYSAPPQCGRGQIPKALKGCWER
jgi:hypothetical protein